MKVKLYFIPARFQFHGLPADFLRTSLGLMELLFFDAIFSFKDFYVTVFSPTFNSF